MLKAHERKFNIIRKLVDAFFVLLSWFIAYELRFNVIPGGQAGLESFIFQFSLLALFLTIYIFYRNGLYDSQRFKTSYHEVSKIVISNVQAIVGSVLILYFFSPNKFSRMTILIYLVVSTFLLVGERLLVRNYLRYIRRKGKNLRHVMLFGDGDQLLEYVERIGTMKDLGINVLCWAGSKGKAEQANIKSVEGELLALSTEFHPDVIIAGFGVNSAHELQELVGFSQVDLTQIQILPDLSCNFIGSTIEHFAGLPLITVNQPRLTTLDYILKRSFDFIVAFIGILCISPLLIFLALLVKLTSKGPIFYGQERMSTNGQTFNMWKFRSMRIDAEAQTGAVWAVKNDNRRTPIGTFLRSTSLDELPQLFNVLLGDMSLVGPRPERPVFIKKFKHQIPQYMLRHKMKAGITGWAQVNGWRGDTSLEKRIECDIYYIKNWTLLFDVKILFMTFWKGFINKNAY